MREILIGQGILCSELGEVRSAIEVYERILAIDKRTGDIHNLIGSELRLGKLCERVGSQEAFAHATNAYKLAEQAGEDRNKLDASDLLFRSFQSTSDKVQGKAMLDQAMAMATKRGVPTELARFHDRFGRLAFSAGDPQEALVRFNSGLKALGYKLPTEAHEPSSAQPTMPLAEILLDMGRCYRQQGDTSNAMTCLKECERVLAEQPELRVYPWADLGELYLEIGSVTKAADYAARALSDLGTDPDKELEKKAADLMYRVHKEQGNTMGALEMLERLYAVSVSKDQERYKLELQRTQLSMTFTAKQLTDSVAQAHVTEALRADNEIARSRSLYLFLGGIVLFLGAAVVAFIDRKRRMARFDREAAQLETQALRSQMNPHFIFNALNSINAFVQKNEPDKATAFLSRFARLMRMVLENSRQSEVPLKDDLDALDAYLHLERARSGEKFDYRIEVAGDIDPEDVMVPPLVAQPFVENAIWHGMSGKTEKGLIKLSVSRKGDQLLFAIEDDGVGRSSPKRMASMGEQDPADGPTKKTSLGTAITKARLDLVRQQKGKAAGFVYVDLPQGTRVELTLPFSTAA